jgi:NAD(P)-dependent dehydrogenase (short-subunit alcohol dehydrogenase family)
VSYLADLFSLDGRIAVVTGGSSGIGQEMARALALAGARVVLVARDESRLADATAGMLAGGGSAAWVSADLAVRSEVSRAAEEAEKAFGPPDILVNCAGVNIRPPFPSLTVQDWDLTLAVNLTAPFLLGQRFGPAMAARGFGRIINVTSQQAQRAFANSGGYGASKGGLASLTRSQSEAWAASGVCSNSVCPGFVATRLNAHLGFRRGDRVPGLAGQRLRDRADAVRGRRILRDVGSGVAGPCGPAGEAEYSVWLHDEAVPPRRRKISKKISSTSTSPRRCAPAISNTRIAPSTSARSPTRGTA